MFAIFKHWHLCQHTFFWLNFETVFWQGDVSILSGGNYCMCVVTCGCCVSYQLNLTGWEGGRGEQRAWTPSPQKTPFGWENVHLKSLCTACRGHTVHEYTYVCWMYCKVKEDIELYMFDLLELLQCQNFVIVQLNEVSGWNSRKAIQR